MMSVQRIDLQLRFWPLLRGEIVLPKVALIRPHLHLVRLADGGANWEFTSQPQSAKAKQEANKPMSLPLVHTLIIQSGKLTARDDMHKVTFDGTVDAAANGPASGAPPLRAGQPTTDWRVRRGVML